MNDISKTIHPVDHHVGERLKHRRKVLGLSQNELGQRLGITFQQVQKYEKGINRIGASRLFELGEILNVNVQYFFATYEYNQHVSEPAPLRGEEDAKLIYAQSVEGKLLLQYFSQIQDELVRKRLLDFIKTIAKDKSFPGS